MDTDLIGITREHAMRLAADLTISGSAEHVVELLRRAQWSALTTVRGIVEAERLVSDQSMYAGWLNGKRSSSYGLQPFHRA